jgi:hypothetical protein
VGTKYLNLKITLGPIKHGHCCTVYKVNDLYISQVYRHDIAEILLKVALSTINLKPIFQFYYALK